MSRALPQITTIIPTYRRPQMLRRAIRSVLRQTYPHLMVAVLDNASGDETAEVVAELARNDPRVHYHCHPENIGASANFIYGMERVETPFFSFLSDDDVLLPEFYTDAVAGLTRFPDAMFFAGTVVVMTPEAKVTSAPLLKWPRDGYYASPEGCYGMMEYSHLIMTGVLFRKEVTQQFGVFTAGLTAADSDLLLRVAARFPLVISRAPSAVFMVHPDSQSALTALQFLGDDWPRILANINADERISADVRAHSTALLLPTLVDRTYRIGVKSVVAGQFDDARMAAAYLRKFYHSPIRARRLERMSAMSQFAPARWSLALVYQAQRLRHAGMDRHLQRTYGNLARYLASES